MFLEQDADGRCFQKDIVLAQFATEDFRNELSWIYSKRYGLAC
jgi:hypothetical protein